MHARLVSISVISGQEIFFELSSICNGAQILDRDFYRFLKGIRVQQNLRNLWIEKRARLGRPTQRPSAGELARDTKQKE
jgi:hypothetical protein